MIDWEWKREEIAPEDVLDAARTIGTNNSRITMELTSHWVDARRYLDWAVTAISRGGEDAWDCAAGWAKRAVCQRMDAILVHSHFGSFLGQNYGKKAEYLSAMNVPGLTVLREMIIDPRNDIEHSYVVAMEEHARRACELAQLFLRATEDTALTPAVLALGWNVSYHGKLCDKPGNEYEFHEFRLSHQNTPMLLIDSHSSEGVVFVLHPKEERLSVCPRRAFDSTHLIDLNAKLKKCFDFISYSQHQFTPTKMNALREHLRL